LLRNIGTFYVHADFSPFHACWFQSVSAHPSPFPLIRIPNKEIAQVLLVAAAPNELIAAERLLRAGESKGAAEVAVANAEAAPLVDGLDLPDTASVLGYKEAGTAVVLAVVPLEKVPAWTCTRVLFVRLAVKLVSICASMELRSGCTLGQKRESC
jgi:hypothetical protein